MIAAMANAWWLGLLCTLACQKDEPPPPEPRPLPPPPLQPSGPVFLLADLVVVMIDESGPRSLANQVQWMDVLPDGTMWGCSVWSVSHWDGKAVTTTKPPFPIEACAAGPDGKLVAVRGTWDHGVDLIATFDGKTWTKTPTKLGPKQFSQFKVFDLVVDRAGVIYLQSWDDRDRRAALHAYVGGTWKQLTSNTHISHLIRGGDGHAYVLRQIKHYGDYPDALSRLTPTEIHDPIFIDDANSGHIYPWIDAAGTWTLHDRVNGTIRRAGGTTKLPAGPSIPPLRHPHPNPFAVDTNGRMWLDLYDGLNVIARDGTRTVFPRGSIAGIAAPIEKIVAIAGGPKLTPSAAVERRRIIGSVTGHEGPLANAPVVMCSYPSNADPPCSDEDMKWTTTTDDKGQFSIPNVPRFRYSIVVKYGDYWHPLRLGCCADQTDFPTVTLPR